MSCAVQNANHTFLQPDDCDYSGYCEDCPRFDKEGCIEKEEKWK